jgi:hypothetical protein
MKPESISVATKRIAGFAHATNPIRRQVVVFALASAALLTLAPSAYARTFKKLHTFVGNSKDGRFPRIKSATGNAPSPLAPKL